MSDNQNEPAQDQYEIELRWEIGAFLPERQNDWAEKGITAISERLSSSMFETLESTKRYWSVPERLLDIRILMLYRDSLIGPQSHNKDADLIPDLRRIQFYLYRIVSRFAEWCFTLGEADRQLSVHQDRDSLPVPPKIKQLISASSRYKKHYNQKDSNESSLGDKYTWKTLETTHYKLNNLVKSVCEKVNGFFEKLKKRDEAKEPPEDTKEKAEEYSIKKLLGDIETIAVKLGIYSPYKDTFDKYLDDSSRCIALLMFLPENQPGNQNLQPKSQYLAFSGFLDCEDKDLPEEFNPEPKLVDQFRKISEVYGAKLITLSHAIVDRITTYMIDEDFSLIKSKTLREAVEEAEENATAQNVKPKDKKILKRYYGSVKKDYSCCERKILAANDLSKEASKTTVLLVKFQPCFNCYAALKEWKKTNNIKLKVHYIPKKLYEDGNTLSASTETLIDPSTNLD